MSVCVKVLIEWLGTVDEANDLLLGKGWKKDYLEDNEINNYANQQNDLGERVYHSDIFVYDFGISILSYENHESDMEDLGDSFKRFSEDERCISMQYWGNTTCGIIKAK